MQYYPPCFLCALVEDISDDKPCLKDDPARSSNARAVNPSWLIHQWYSLNMERCQVYICGLVDLIRSHIKSVEGCAQ